MRDNFFRFRCLTEYDRVIDYIKNNSDIAKRSDNPEHYATSIVHSCMRDVMYEKETYKILGMACATKSNEKTITGVCKVILTIVL